MADKYVERLEQKIEELQDTVETLQKELRKEHEAKQSCEFRIQTELEPRIRQEGCSYDNYVATDPCAEASDAFEFRVDEHIEMVKESPLGFDWEESNGDVYEMILYLIKSHIQGKLQGSVHLSIDGQAEMV